MTYNFDPDRWLEDQRRVLELRLAGGELDRQEYERALDELDRRYESMLDRIDGSFQLATERTRAKTS